MDGAPDDDALPVRQRGESGALERCCQPASAHVGSQDLLDHHHTRPAQQRLRVHRQQPRPLPLKPTIPGALRGDQRVQLARVDGPDVGDEVRTLCVKRSVGRLHAREALQRGGADGQRARPTIQRRQRTHHRGQFTRNSSQILEPFGLTSIYRVL